MRQFEAIEIVASRAKCGLIEVKEQPSDLHDAVLKSIADEDHPMVLPHAFKRIRLNLARSKEFPAGSSQHGYEFVAPLDDKNHIDAAVWRTHREDCKVRRFWQGEDEQLGQLVHKPGGQEHARWVFDYNRHRVDDDEAGYRFGAHAFTPGEYVTISDQDQSHTFRVASVDPAP